MPWSSVNNTTLHFSAFFNRADLLQAAFWHQWIGGYSDVPAADEELDDVRPQETLLRTKMKRMTSLLKCVGRVLLQSVGVGAVPCERLEQVPTQGDVVP